MPNRRFIAKLAIALVLTGLTGCGVLGGGPSPFPDRYPLGDEARAARICAPQDVPRELNKHWLSEYRVEAGDGLLVLPVDLDSKIRFSGDYTVLADGTIDLGKYGRLHVAGRTVTEIEAGVQQVVKQAETAKDMNVEIGFIDVRLVNRQSKAYYVLGEVTTPGRFPLIGSETVLDGIIQAGGLTDRSSWRDIVLVRPTGDGQGQVMKVDYGAIVRTGAAGTNYQLLPGDRIYVGSRHLIDLIFNLDRFR